VGISASDLCERTQAKTYFFPPWHDGIGHHPTMISAFSVGAPLLEEEEGEEGEGASGLRPLSVAVPRPADALAMQRAPSTPQALREVEAATTTTTTAAAAVHILAAHIQGEREQTEGAATSTAAHASGGGSNSSRRSSNLAVVGEGRGWGKIFADTRTHARAHMHGGGVCLKLRPRTPPWAAAVRTGSTREGRWVRPCPHGTACPVRAQEATLSSSSLYDVGVAWTQGYRSSQVGLFTPLRVHASEAARARSEEQASTRACTLACTPGDVGAHAVRRVQGRAPPHSAQKPGAGGRPHGGPGAWAQRRAAGCV